MFTAAEFDSLRVASESLMQDRFAGFAPGAPVVDANGMSRPGWAPLGETAGKVQASSAAGRDTAVRTVTVGGSELRVVEAGLHVPVSAFVVDGVLVLAPGCELQCIDVGPGTDPAVMHSRWRVVSVPAKSWATARRLDVAQVAPLDLPTD